MTLVYLKPENYFVNQNGDLCNNLKGYSFVMFTSDKCEYCNDIKPAFHYLPNTIQGCIFAEMNIDQQKQKIRMIASQSKTPINYVPYVILYLHGIPIAQYIPDEKNPQANFEKIKLFLINQTKKNQTPTNNNQQQQLPNNNRNIPEYSLAKPSNTKRVCYLTAAQAYGKDIFAQ